MRFEGSEGWVACADGYKKPDVSDPKLLEDFDRIVQEYSERTGRPMSGLPGADGVFYHARNFFNCMRDRKQTVANADVMFHSMSTVHAANITMWLRQDMTYDSGKMEFGSADANGFRARTMRQPWVI
jgi:hypothetical protein